MAIGPLNQYILFVVRNDFGNRIYRESFEINRFVRHARTMSQPKCKKYVVEQICGQMFIIFSFDNTFCNATLIRATFY